MLQQVLGLEGDRVWTAASGFGGGMARHQYVCGAVTGAVIALGLYGGQTVADPRLVADTMRSRVRELIRGFARTFGSAECSGLIPFDFNADGQYEEFRQSGVKQRQCNQYVRYAVETVSRWAAEGKLARTEG